MNKVFGIFLFLISYFILLICDTLIAGFFDMIKTYNFDISKLLLYFYLFIFFVLAILGVTFANGYSSELMKKPDPDSPKIIKNKIFQISLFLLLLIITATAIIILDVSVIKILHKNLVKEAKIAPYIVFFSSVVFSWIIQFIRKKQRSKSELE